VSATGLDLIQLQYLVFPFLAIALALVAFVLYRELTQDAVVAIFATFFLLLQPDFLFVIFRGSHEKMTWLLTMSALYLLARSFRVSRDLAAFSINVGVFYLILLAVITTNTFFGSSFIVAVLVSLAASWLLFLLAGRPAQEQSGRTIVSRLLYILLIATVLWYLNTYHFYEPAGRFLQDLKNLIDRAAAIGLGQEAAYDPYATAGWGWISQEAYWGLVLPSFALSGVAFVIWIFLGWSILRGKALIRHSQGLLLWAFYGGFGLQFAASLIVSWVGGAVGNLQQRYFPIVLWLGLPLVAWAIVRLWRSTGRRVVYSRLFASALAIFVLWSSGASLFKMTNDPSLSNYWSFWIYPEEAAVGWIEDHTSHRSVWLGLDSIRIDSRAKSLGFGEQSGNWSDTWQLSTLTRHVLISDVDRSLGFRRHLPLPDVRKENRIYDNGDVMHYHLRPQTPYQR
jgi:hypothetical protein